MKQKLQEDMTEYEQREVDYAVAVSLAEEDQKLKDLFIHEKMIKAEVEEDEQIAKALQESIFLGSSPANDRKYTSEAHPFLDETQSKICVGCKLGINSGFISEYKGLVWHPECLLCHACKRVIKYEELYMYKNRHPYHTSCHREMRHPKCHVCKSFIPNSNGVVEYGEHPFWEQKYCPSHEHDGTFKCYSCERLEPKDDDRHTILTDGRNLCPECSSFVIMDTNECQPLFLEVQGFFESLQMKVDQEIPLSLVERETLNEAMEGQKKGHHHLSETRGLCLSEEQPIPIVQRRGKIGRRSQIFEMLKPERFVCCEVTAILILFGLPRLLTGSLLAHEMMHAWLTLNGYLNLKPEIEEGICQVLAHMWLKSEINSKYDRDIVSSSSSSTSSSSSSSSFSWGRYSNKSKLTEIERKLGECFIRQIELDSSSAYGDGFRVGHQAVSKYGLKATLDHIKLAATFPIISTSIL